MKLLLITSCLLILPALILRGQVEFKNEKDDFLKTAQTITGSENLTYVIQDTLRTAVFVNDQNEKNYFVQSMDFKQVYGYRGYTNLGIIFDSEGKIIKVELISSQDTRNYVRMIQRSNYFDQFEGYDGKSDFFTVTQATITTQALNETIEYTSIRFKQLLDYLKDDTN